MVTGETKPGPTPHGGVRSEIIYLDDEGELADKSKATAAEILEYDADGDIIFRTYGRIVHKN